MFGDLHNGKYYRKFLFLSKQEKGGESLKKTEIYANNAAPIIPALLRSCAGCTGVFIERIDSNFSNFLLVPPPIINKSG